MSNPDPHGYYQDELADRQALEANLETRDRRLSYARLATVGVAALLGWGALAQGWWSAWWLVAPGLCLSVLVVVHDRVIRRRLVASRAVQWCERGLARLEDRWHGSGASGERFLDDAHPYASDLDLFGSGSLFQLLNTAQTHVGDETLAAWLLNDCDPVIARRRQTAVRDLATRTQLREDLHTLGADVRAGVDSAMVVAWATADSPGFGRWLRPVALLLSGAVIVTSIAWVAGLVSGGVPVALVLLTLGAGMRVRKLTDRVLHQASRPARELRTLGALLGRLRAEPFEADELREMQTGLGQGRRDPVAAVARLNQLIQMHDWEHNMMFAPVGAVLLWSVHCACAVEAWRARHGPKVEPWLRTVGAYEALAALGTYHFEHPADPFPEFVGAEQGGVFDGEQVVHPLIPTAKGVSNDIQLGTAPQLLVVSGSNMSGKTTLLRTVGINTVLAFAGAPVRARRLRLSPLTVGATLRVQDSLLQGRSRFYAELTRLRQLVNLARQPTPLLFLLDELFHGTNSHDRVEGAHGVLRFFLRSRAIGLVTTHDLALAAVADRFGSRATNVHFEDQVVDDTLAFDYRLCAGKATRGNALVLMKAVGLDVD